MTAEYDRADKTANYHHDPDVMADADLPPMTPETARHLAAILAPHLVAMRAVTAGTQYSVSGENDANDANDAISGGAAPAISPTTRIFIYGMLQRIPV
jgi:hypothetical protein